MATSLHEGEAVPTCSICVDVFRDPVTLPCQHDFCRPCLQMFAEKSKSSADDCVDVDDTDQEVTVTVTCPVCRSPADLGSTGVPDLPTNASLADLVRKFQAEDNTCDQDIPKCSVCEDDNRSPAVKSCQTCNFLYCQECLMALHPMRGALKRHELIPIEEFLRMTDETRMTGQSGTTDKPGVTGQSGMTDKPGVTEQDTGDSARPIPCDKHSQPLSIFCVSCQDVICLKCMEGHTDHPMRSIESACHKLKVPLEEKTGEYSELKDQMDKLRTEMNALWQDIQDNEDAHRGDIERAYTTATEALNCWRREALEVVEKRHSDWRREWKAAMKDLDMKAEEIDRMIETSNDLISSLYIVFLQGSKQLKTRLEDQLPDMKTSIRRQEEIKTKMRESVSGDPVIPRLLSVKESILSTPEIKFSETDDDDLKMADEGSMVKFVGVVDKTGREAWTGVCLPPGNSYWELEITIQPCQDGLYNNCMLGVKHQWSDLVKSTSSTSSWWMGLRYDPDNFRCNSPCGDVRRVDRQWRPHTGSHRLGFCLDTEKRTLIIVDCVQNQVMFTSNSIDVSKPLFPAVRFRCVMSASARLITGDHCILPRVIFDILCKTA